MAPVGVGVRKNGTTKTTTSSSTTSTSSSSSISCLQGRPHGLKKGPWTAAEDAILMEYVKKHGEGNWNAVQRNSGLMRCGKSCRLRWANHLRPNLKKGAFCSEEEERIVELHYKHGNKWARMAAQLPGRTDNEIKNYWNTRVKRCLRAGLPIYPRDVSGGGKVNGYYHHHNHNQQLRENNNIQTINNSSSSSSASALTSLLSAAPPPPLPSSLPPLVAGGLNPAASYRATTHLSLFDMFNPNSVSTTSGCSVGGSGGGCSYFPNPTCNNQTFGGVGATTSGGELALSLLSGSQPPPPTPSSSSSLPNSLLLPSMPINCIQYNNSCMDFRGDLMMTTTTMSPPDVGGVVELPSIQSFAPRATTTTTTTTTPTSSDNNCSDNNYNMIATTSSTTDVDDHEEDFLMRGNSTGLLEDLIDGSSQALSRSKQSKEMMSPVIPPVVEIKSEDNYLWDYKVMDGLNLGQYNNNLIHDKHAQDSSCSMGAKLDHSRTPEESNPVVDDDFLSLLDNFPMSTVPAVPSVPDWCNGNYQTMAKNEEHDDLNPSSSTENQNRSHEHEKEHNQELESSKNPTTTPMTTEDHSFEIGVCCWKNLPGIY